MIAVSSIVWKINSEPLDDTALPHLSSIHAVSAYHHHSNTARTDPENIYSTQQSDHFKFRLTRFYHQITNLFCCTHPISSPVFGCSVNNLSGPHGANSSTGNLLEATNLTNVNSTNNNTIYGQHHHRRFLPRLPNGSSRSNHHHPYGAMFYSDCHFDYRPPPPSYQQSVQEYRLRMLLYERANGLNNNNLDVNSILNNSTTLNGTTTNSSVPVTNTITNTGNVQTSSTTTFSGLLSNLGSFVSNSFSGNNQQNFQRNLSPPPIYRSNGSTLAGNDF